MGFLQEIQVFGRDWSVDWEIVGLMNDAFIILIYLTPQTTTLSDVAEGGEITSPY